MGVSKRTELLRMANQKILNDFTSPLNPTPKNKTSLTCGLQSDS